MISVVKGPISPLPDSISEAEKAIALSVIEKHKQYCNILLFYTEDANTEFNIIQIHSFTSIFLSQLLHLTLSKI